MIAVIQRVNNATVYADGELSGSIGKGLYILLGVTNMDTEEDASLLAEKIAKLRIFSDDNGKMNLSLADVGSSVLFVSQFTLIADVSRGNRPSFSEAMRPDEANEIYLYCAKKIAEYGVGVKLGVFGADMVIEQVNHGPVTIIYEV